MLQAFCFFQVNNKQCYQSLEMENDSVKVSLKRKLPRKLKPIQYLRSTEIDAFLSDSGSEGRVLFDDEYLGCRLF